MNYDQSQLLPEVTIVIVTFNGLKTLPDCLKSVFQQTYRHFTTILVDNASTDGTSDWVRQHYPQVCIHHRSDNRGPNPARNQGILAANTDLVLLLDDDALMAEDCLEALVKATQTHPAAAWGGRLVYHDCPSMIQHEGGFIHYLAEANLLSRDVPLQEGLQKITPVHVISGTCMLLKKSAALKIGLFDEDYFFGRADGEFTFRLVLSGHRLLTVPGAVVRHRVKSRGISKVFYQVRNRWYFMLIQFDWQTLIATLPALLVYETSLILFLLSRGAIWPYLRANWAVVWNLPMVLRKRRAFQPLKVMADAAVLQGTCIYMREDLIGHSLIKRLKTLLDSFFSSYWTVVMPLLHSRGA